jgi:hypothetical protein
VSIEAHPNLHAVGLQVDILKAIEARLRGKGLEIPKARLMTEINSPILYFVMEIDNIVDKLSEELLR